MVDDFRLSAEPREQLGTRNTRQLRKQGRVPANLYGFKKDTINISVAADDVEKLVAGGSKVVDVEFQGEVDKAVVQELQWDIYSTYVKHVDLKRVDPDATTTTDVPVKVRGEAAGLKDGGQLRQLVKYVTVTCPEFRVPRSVAARVASLGVGDSLKVSDLKAPETVTITSDADQVVVEVFDPKKAGASDSE
ncbi:MAG: 50S ribosomal protein L25/general stress protein Ctc [Fuerstiella sp.]